MERETVDLYRKALRAIERFRTIRRRSQMIQAELLLLLRRQSAVAVEMDQARVLYEKGSSRRLKRT